MPGSDTPTPEETGPVIHDNRRIDPVTGQARRGKHAASKPAGTTGAGRPGGGPEGTDEPTVKGQQTGQGTQREEATSASTAGTSARAGAGQAGEVDQDAASTGSSGASDGPAGQVGSADPENTAAKITELTADLQRLQAEYANYRKRVERDRASVKEQAVAATLIGLLPVLDAIDQAREHGELSGGFKSVADQLQAAVSRLGLVTYGEKGDSFDPKIHEALTSSYSTDVTEDTCVDILQPGYMVGERILRPARVAVAEPGTGPDGASNEPSWPSPDEEGN
jgi:molecular chaperone GrpE